MSTDELDDELLKRVSDSEALYPPQYRQTPFFSDIDLERLKTKTREESAESQRRLAPYVSPTATEEDVFAEARRAQEKADQRVAEASQVIRRAGKYTLPVDISLGRSELIPGTGGLKFDEESGEFVQMGALEHLYEAGKRQRLAETSPYLELARRVREGEMTREEAGFPEEESLVRPLSESGLEEDFFDQALGVLNSTQPFIGEAIFGGDRLFYRVDADGNPLDPEAPAYRAEQYLKKVFPEYMSQGELFGASEDRRVGGESIERGVLGIPRPFQATTRTMGQFSASSQGEYLHRVADQIAQRRELGHEFQDLPLFDKDLFERTGGELVLGMRPSFASGTAASVFIPTPFGVPSLVATGAAKTGKAVAAAAEKAAAAIDVAAGKYDLGGIPKIASSILQPGAVTDRLASRAAARKAVGVDVVDDGLEAPTLRTLAVDRAVSPAATSLEMAAIAREALDAGGKLNLKDMSARFGGNPTAAKMLNQASKISAGPADIIDPRALDVVANTHMNAADFRVVLSRLTAKARENPIDADAARSALKGMVSPKVYQSLEPLSEAQLANWLRSTLKSIGEIPNTKNTFVNAMYATGTDLMKSVRAGASPSEMVGRTVKGLGSQGRLFQDNLMRALIEEGALAGKNVAKLMGQMARKPPSNNRLKTMLDALGDGRGSVAVAKAFKETMNTIGRDRIMQHLPDDYAFVSNRFMVKMDKFADTKRAMRRAAEDLYTVEGTRSRPQKVVPADGRSVDEIIETFVSEVGPSAVRAEEGSNIARGIVRKIKAGVALNDVEFGVFGDVMRDAMARRVSGIAEAVTEGAQTALGRNLAAIQNALYTDAYSGINVGKASVGARRIRAAASEVLRRAPIYKEAAKGNAAASLVTSDQTSKGITASARDSFEAWYTRLVDSPVIADPFFGYSPQTSVVAETYARRIGDLVGTAAERMISTFVDMATGPQEITGPKAITTVLKSMTDEVDKQNAAIFTRKLDALLNQRAAAVQRATGFSPTTLPISQMVSDAEQVAQMMASKVTARKAPDLDGSRGLFQLGAGAINDALRADGHVDGIRSVRKLSAAEAVGAIRKATIKVLADQKNDDDWVSMLTTLMPGKSSADFVLKGSGGTELEITLSEAVKLIRENPLFQTVLAEEASMLPGVKAKAQRIPVNFDKHGNLIPDLEGTRAVLELLIEKNGPEILESTLQYSDVMSFVKRGVGRQAWTEGVQAWLVHQRAGIDASRVFNEMIDVAPELLLDFVPDNPVASKMIHESSLNQIMGLLNDLQQKAVGVGGNNAVWTDAYLRAQEFIASGDKNSAALNPLAQTFFAFAKHMKTIDFSMSMDDRVTIATAMMKQSASGRGKPDFLPQIKSFLDKSVQASARETPTIISEAGAEAQKTLKSHLTSVVVNERMLEPFMEHLENVAKANGTTVSMKPKTMEALLSDIFHNGVLDGSVSVFDPIYRQFQNTWRQAGLLMDGGFVPSLDTQRFTPQSMKPMFGSEVSLSSGINLSAAQNKLRLAIASGRLQKNLEDLSVRAKKTDPNEGGATTSVALAATAQLAQTMTRTARSTLLAGGGILAFGPNPLYQFGNIGSVPEIVTATIGAENAMKVAGFVPEGLSSAARNARSFFFRQTISRALAPITDPNRVVINSPFYGNITAKELDDMMDAANIKFSRASIEAYESIASQMMEAAKLNLGKHPLVKAGKVKGLGVQILRMFNPASMHEWMKFAEDTDGVTRRATFIAMLADGNTVEQAAMLARESILDYGKVAASGNMWSQIAQRWTMFWAFRRQSLLMTANSLADGKFGRRELMGRWIRLQGSQKKGASPEEFLFGESYIKGRMYITPGTDEYGFNAAAPSVLSEGLGDFVGYMTTLAVGADAVVHADAEKFAAFQKLAIELLAEENFEPLSAAIAEYYKTVGRDQDKGPLVSDLHIAQLMALDAKLGTNTFKYMKDSYWAIDLDKEGEPVVNRGRPYLQSEGAVRQKPHQYRFKNNETYRAYLLVQLLYTYMGMARTPDEWTKMALTVDDLVPTGFKPAYRSQVNMIQFMTRAATPLRKSESVEQKRARLRMEQKRRIERVK